MPYQTTMFAQLDADVDLDAYVVLIGDPRWTECVNELRTAKWVCIDTEFCSKEDGPWKRREIDYWYSLVRLIQVGLPSGRVLVFELGGLLDPRDVFVAQHAEALEVLRVVVEDPKIPKCGMALLTEYMLLRIHFGWKMRCMRDVMLMSQVLWAGVGTKGVRWTEKGLETSPVMKHNLASICDRLGIFIDKTEQLSDWAGRLSNRQYNYAARDVIAPREAWLKMAKTAKRDGIMKSFQAECDAQPAFCECEYNGLPIDLDIAHDDLAAWEKVRDEFLQPFKEKFPRVNPNSPMQVATALSEELGHSFFESKTIRGKVKQQPVTSDEALVPFKKVPYVNSLLEGRSTNACMNWLRAAIENAFINVRESHRGSRIRADFKQIAGGFQEHGTTNGEAGRGMGRSSASRPINTQNPSNLQPAHEKAGAASVRRSIRPQEGRAFIVADLSQAHARIAAQWSQDPIMLRDFNAGVDFHLAMTHRVMEQDGLSITFEEAKEIADDKSHALHKELKNRRLGCKSTNYAKINLSGVQTLKTQMETMPIPIFMTEDQVERLIDTWNDLYKVFHLAQRVHIRKVNSHRCNFKEIGIEGEYGESRALTGRRLFLVKEWKRSGYWSVKATDAVSSIWMMTESDIVKRAMGQLVPIFDDHLEWDVLWCNMAHDEIDVECKKEYALEVATVVQQKFHEAMKWAGIVDLPVDEMGASPEKLVKENWSAK